MLWDFKLFYRSSSIIEIKHVLRPNSRFLKFEARIESQYRARIESQCRAPAHLVVHRAVTREVVSSRLRPYQHSGSLNN